MNYRQGLIRIWIVLSVIWVGSVLATTEVLNKWNAYSMAQSELMQAEKALKDKGVAPSSEPPDDLIHVPPTAEEAGIRRDLLTKIEEAKSARRSLGAALLAADGAGDTGTAKALADAIRAVDYATNGEPKPRYVRNPIDLLKEAQASAKRHLDDAVTDLRNEIARLIGYGLGFPVGVLLTAIVLRWVGRGFKQSKI